MEWRQQILSVLAHSEFESREWWGGLSDAERNPVLGLEDEQASLF